MVWSPSDLPLLFAGVIGSVPSDTVTANVQACDLVGNRGNHGSSR